MDVCNNVLSREEIDGLSKVIQDNEIEKPQIALEYSFNDAGQEIYGFILWLAEGLKYNYMKDVDFRHITLHFLRNFDILLENDVNGN